MKSFLLKQPSFLIMPTQRLSKYKERLELVRRIEKTGIAMSPPCSRCENNGRICVISEVHSTRCNECVRRGQRCDVEGPSIGDWRSIEREEERIEREEAEASAAASAALAKLQRLQKQKRFLKNRAGEMLRRGLKTLDELDEAEEREREEEERKQKASDDALRSSEEAAPPTGFSGVADNVLAPLSPSFWSMLDFVGGTAPEPSGS